jgi:class 3 adenylate cyclase
MDLLNVNETASALKSITCSALVRCRRWGKWTEQFLANHNQHERHRALRTFLFTDIVGSTGRAAEMGDRQWVEVLEKYYTVVRKELAIFRGHEIDTTGDGFLATFEVPAQAIRCASAIRDVMGSLGLQIKAGLHAGECERLGNSIAGIAVHIGARVVAIAGPGEVLVSSTIRELVMGSGIGFVDHGTHSLKGVPGEWRLFLALGTHAPVQGVPRIWCQSAATLSVEKSTV